MPCAPQRGIASLEGGQVGEYQAYYKKT